jgi:hypothetical protein
MKSIIGLCALLGGVLSTLPIAGCIAAPSTPAAETQPPISIQFTTPEAGYVTLVIEDAEGHRVRNLISETPFEAGAHTVYWDGQDEGARVAVPRTAGIYTVQRSLVKAGEYRVRGLFRKALDLRYEFTVYPTGIQGVPWPTNLRAGEGGWLADHSAPVDALFVAPQNTADKTPQVVLSAGIAEAGIAVAWVDLSGKKVRGVWRLGGNWTGAEFLAGDNGANALPGVQAYTGSAWSNDQNKKQREIRLNILTKSNDRTVLDYPLPPLAGGGNTTDTAELTGLTVRDKIIVAALGSRNQLLFVSAFGNTPNSNAIFYPRRRDSKDLGKVLGTVPFENPGAMIFDAKGQLLILVGRELHRYNVDLQKTPPVLSGREVLIRQGLEEPRRLALDASGNIYISDWGNSHQVKVFSPDGKYLRAIGKSGAPQAGPYDPAHMTCPNGLTISSDGHLWVAERDAAKAPKRISVWTLDGQFLHAMYGPPKYGGGGSLDPRDPTRFYYAEKSAGMEFKLDWQKGTSELKSVYWRPGANDLQLPNGWIGPQAPLYVGGRQYMTNNYNSHPVAGTSILGIWRMQNGVAIPAAFIGNPQLWSLLKNKEFASVVPAEFDLDKPVRQQRAAGWFAWSDKNGDGQVQPNELTFGKREKNGWPGRVSLNPDLSVNIGFNNEVLRLAPRQVLENGVPLYDAADAVQSADLKGVDASRGAEILVSGNRMVLTGGPILGLENGKPQWLYHSRWPSLHAGHSAPRQPEYSGELLATTRLLGTPVKVGDETLWAINSDKGVIYLFTIDGFFVATLGRYPGEAPPWNMPEAKRNMALSDVNFNSEHFWPTLNQTPDGKVYLVAGKEHSSLVRIDGLDTLRRLPTSTLRVTDAMLAEARTFAMQRSNARMADEDALQVKISDTAPTLDGDLREWSDADWVNVDNETRAALAVSGDTLYAALKTTRDRLLDNAGGDITTLFRGGGALDLQLATSENADAKRQNAVAGDERLLIAQANGKTVAALFRPVAPGAAKPVPYSSPQRTITIDRVDDVSNQIRIVAGRTQEATKRRPMMLRTYEVAIPLTALGLQPRAALTLRGDIGVLIGQNGETVARSYWHNKAGGIVSDVPSEAELKPNLWGEWYFTAKAAEEGEDGEDDE